MLLGIVIPTLNEEKVLPITSEESFKKIKKMKLRLL